MLHSCTFRPVSACEWMQRSLALRTAQLSAPTPREAARAQQVRGEVVPPQRGSRSALGGLTPFSWVVLCPQSTVQTAACYICCLCKKSPSLSL